MAKQTAPPTTGPRLYVVLLATTDTDLVRLGVVKARDADKAMAQFLDYEPKDLVGIPANRWNERKNAQLRNKPEIDLGEPVPVIEGQMELEAAA